MAFVRHRAAFRKQLFLNFKGGTGKTTISVAYGLELVAKGYRVLFVDADPQGHMTKCLGVNTWQFDRTLYHAIMLDIPMGRVVRKVPGLSARVVPADISLSSLELSLGELSHREWRLVDALASMKNDYDVAIIDASPSISMVNLNAILSADDLIIPVLPDSLSVHGLSTLIKTLEAVEVDFEHQLENIGVLLNRFVENDGHCTEVATKLGKEYPDYLLKTRIRQWSDLAKQAFGGRIGSRLKVNGEIVADIESLVSEISPLLEEERRSHEKRKGKQSVSGK